MYLHLIIIIHLENVVVLREYERAVFLKVTIKNQCENLLLRESFLQNRPFLRLL